MGRGYLARVCLYNVVMRHHFAWILDMPARPLAKDYEIKRKEH